VINDHHDSALFLIIPYFEFDQIAQIFNLVFSEMIVCIQCHHKEAIKMYLINYAINYKTKIEVLAVALCYCTYFIAFFNHSVQA
jgi:hypothetical protein